ncbi:siderophore-interacting protein [Bifidobacterium asteroides]|uniref:siderophore-interacting protein n=1 Tax=Bifidobacterium asteroides TaxID=1684 RepID=UPI00274279C1|nr:siderophore-interacting protein [Bifidobacterium asteroides]WLT10635.1 siderophore-interacting protein [Bifidobacterium asteroides]
MEHQASRPVPLIPFRVTVARAETLSPHFKRIVFQGPDLQNFADAGYDERIKILLPLPDGSLPAPSFFEASPEDPLAWYQKWRALPAERRNPLRTYTVRKVRPGSEQIDVDFVIHDHAGPAGAFAEAAKPGDQAIIIGPNAQAEGPVAGMDFHPGQSRHLLLVGDETAVPAIAAIMDSLIRDHWQGEGMAVIEVPTEEDRLPLPEHEGIRIIWTTCDESGHGQALTEAMRSLLEDLPIHSPTAAAAESSQEFTEVDIDKELLWETADAAQADASIHADDLYAWIAGEAATVRELRRMLVRDRGMDRRNVSFMGYWRQGRSEMS